jgi:hypothetical protein
MKLKSAFAKIIMVFLKLTRQISPQDLHRVLNNGVIQNKNDIHPLTFYCDNYRKMQVDRIVYYYYESLSDDFTCEIWMADFHSATCDDFDIILVDTNRSYRFNLINSNYNIIYKNDSPEIFYEGDNNISTECICVILKFRIMRDLNQKQFAVILKSRKSKTFFKFEINWARNHEGFSFSEPDEHCENVCLSSLKIDGKCILFAKEKFFHISGCSLPTLIKHKESGEIVELSLDSFRYQDDCE